MPNTNEVRDIPYHIVKYYSGGSLYINVIHVNSIMFLAGASNTHWSHTMFLQKNKVSKKFLEAILIIIREYRAQRVFNVISIGANKVFKSINLNLKTSHTKLRWLLVIPIDTPT